MSLATQKLFVRFIFPTFFCVLFACGVKAPPLPLLPASPGRFATPTPSPTPVPATRNAR